MPRLRPAAHLPPATTRQRIGLFGGSFDPPHGGHLHVAETAMKRLDLDQVWWFPTPGNPLKRPPGEYQARLASVQILIRRNRAMRVSDIEYRSHIHFTVDLVHLLKAHCPHAKLVWIMGSDSLTHFHHWKDWQRLAHMVPIAVIARPGAMVEARTSHFASVFRRARLPRRMSWRLATRSAPAWTYLTAPLNRESSTQIRSRRSA